MISWECDVHDLSSHAHVHGLLDRMVALEALMSKLDQSNEQLVRWSASSAHKYVDCETTCELR